MIQVVSASERRCRKLSVTKGSLQKKKMWNFLQSGGGPILVFDISRGPKTLFFKQKNGLVSEKQDEVFCAPTV